jgi:hypothetical protein
MKHKFQEIKFPDGRFGYRCSQCSGWATTRNGDGRWFRPVTTELVPDDCPGDGGAALYLESIKEKTTV